MENRQKTLDGGLTKPYTDEFLLRDLYETQELSVAEIAEILECSETTVRNYMRWFGIECRNGVDRDPSPAWFGTRPDGYECWNDGHQTVYVHRLVAVAEWGFEAVASGVIHHKNQIQWDNRPENLHPFESNSAHIRHHARPSTHEDQQTIDEVIRETAKTQLTFDDF